MDGRVQTSVMALPKEKKECVVNKTRDGVIGTEVDGMVALVGYSYVLRDGRPPGPWDTTPSLLLVGPAHLAPHDPLAKLDESSPGRREVSRCFSPDGWPPPPILEPPEVGARSSRANGAERPPLPHLSNHGRTTGDCGLASTPLDAGPTLANFRKRTRRSELLIF